MYYLLYNYWLYVGILNLVIFVFDILKNFFLDFFDDFGDDKGMMFGLKLVIL